MKLPWGENKLRFEFAAPFYEEPSAVEYQVRLEGSDNDWSAWSRETTRDYTHLPEGPYRFRVRARTPHGAIKPEERRGFITACCHPGTGRGGRGIPCTCRALGGFGVWGIVRLRTRQLEEDKRNLEVIVEERTAEVRQQRDEIQVQRDEIQVQEHRSQNTTVEYSADQGCRRIEDDGNGSNR